MALHNREAEEVQAGGLSIDRGHNALESRMPMDDGRKECG